MNHIKDVVIFSNWNQFNKAIDSLFAQILRPINSQSFRLIGNYGSVSKWRRPLQRIVMWLKQIEQLGAPTSPDHPPIALQLRQSAVHYITISWLPYTIRLCANIVAAASIVLPDARVWVLVAQLNYTEQFNCCIWLFAEHTTFTRLKRSYLLFQAVGRWVTSLAIIDLEQINCTLLLCSTILLSNTLITRFVLVAYN